MEFDRYKVAKEKLEQSQKANSAGVLMSYEVCTMEDERVCSDCAKFEGYTTSVTQAVIGVNHPPFHDDCRCFAAYKVEGIRKKEPEIKEEPVIKEFHIKTKEEPQRIEEPRKKSLGMRIKEKFKR